MFIDKRKKSKILTKSEKSWNRSYNLSETKNLPELLQRCQPVNCKTANGKNFLQGSINVCPTKQQKCRMIEKIGHSAKICRSQIPLKSNYQAQEKHVITTTHSTI